MKLLLDTHILLWARADPTRLPAMVREAMADTGNQKIISVVSLTEIAIKASLGKIEVADGFFDTVGDLGASVEPFETRHAKLLARLPWIHRDPFGRMLVAQAIVDGATMVTMDERILRYSVPVLG